MQPTHVAGETETKVKRVPRRRHIVTRIALFLVSVEIFLMLIGVLPETMSFVLLALIGLGLAVAYDD